MFEINLNLISLVINKIFNDYYEIELWIYTLWVYGRFTNQLVNIKNE